MLIEDAGCEIHARFGIQCHVGVHPRRPERLLRKPVVVVTETGCESDALGDFDGVLGVRGRPQRVARKGGIDELRPEHDELLLRVRAEVVRVVNVTNPVPVQSRGVVEIDTRQPRSDRELVTAFGGVVEVSPPSDFGLTFVHVEDIFANGDIGGRSRSFGCQVWKRFPYDRALVTRPVEERIFEKRSVSLDVAPVHPEECTVLARPREPGLVVVAVHNVVDIALEVLGRVDANHVELVPVVETGRRLEDDVRQARSADRIFSDQLEQTLELLVARGQQNARVVERVAGSVIVDFPSRDLDTAADRRRDTISLGDVEP